MRKKLDEKDKKKKITATVDERLLDMMEQHMEYIGEKKKSRFVEKLVKKKLGEDEKRI